MQWFHTPVSIHTHQPTCRQAHVCTPNHPSIQAQPHPHPHPNPGAQVCFPEPTGCSTPTPTPRAGLGGGSLQGLSDPPAWQEWGAQAALPAGLVSAVGPKADLLPHAVLPQGRGLLEGLGAQTGQPRTDSGPLSRPTVEGKHGPCPRTPSSGPQVPMHSARPCMSVLTAGHRELLGGQGGRRPAVLGLCAI